MPAHSCALSSAPLHALISALKSSYPFPCQSSAAHACTHLHMPVPSSKDVCALFHDCASPHMPAHACTLIHTCLHHAYAPSIVPSRLPAPLASPVHSCTCLHYGCASSAPCPHHPPCPSSRIHLFGHWTDWVSQYFKLGGGVLQGTSSR